MKNKSAHEKWTMRIITFGELIDLEKKGKLVVQPKYQRDFFWSKENQEDYIRNVFFVGYPLSLLFYVTPEGVREVIDGHQRITTLLNYAKTCSDEDLSHISGIQFSCIEYVDVSYEERQLMFYNANGQTALSDALMEKTGL